VRLLARQGAYVRVASRRLGRAQQVCADVKNRVPDASLEPIETGDADSLRAAIDGAAVLVAAGAPGVELMPEEIRGRCTSLKVAVDLNAVPPAGLGGIEPQDKAQFRDGQICYGAIAVGGVKMKLHKAAIRRLFETSDLVLDAEEVYELGKAMTS
jgi:NAD(P)-dependent dehydrogenase (short-subunit alcohol dehydrogenase family)